MKYGEAFNTYLSNSSMRVRRQANEFINLHKQLGQVDKQTKKAKLSQAEYDSQTQKTINDLGQVSFKAKAAAIGVKALGVAIQTAFNVGISLVINGIITGISEFVNKQKELEELSQEAADNIKTELTSLEEYSVKISKLRTELDEANTTTERATEIRNELYEIQNNLIENYGIEKDSINLVTGSLKEQIAQIRELGKAEYESNFYSNTRATLDVIDKLNNTQLDLDRRVSKGFYENGNFIDFSKEVEEVMSKILNDSELINSTWDSSHWTLDTNAFDAHDALLNLQKQVEDTISSLDVRDYRNVGEFSYIRKQYQEVLNYLSDVNREFTKPLTEHKEELVQYIKYASKYTEEYWDLVKLRSEYEIAKEKGTEEEILKARQAFNEKYNSLVIATEDGAIRWYFDEEFGNTTKEVENKVEEITYPIRDSFNELSDALDGVYDAFDTAFSNQSTIQSAFDKIQSGTDLTAAEMRSLIKLCKKDFPEIGSLFTKTEKGYTISAENLIKANDAIMQSTKDTVNEQIKGYQEIVDAWEHRSYDDKGFVANLGITEEDYNDAKQQIENLNRVLDAFGLTLDDGTDSLEKYTKALKTFSTNLTAGASAQKEMNESGQLSASTLESLLSLGEDYIKCITIENGVIKFNAEIFKDITKAKLDDEIATLKLAKAEAIHDRIQDAMYNKGGKAKELQAVIDDIDLKLRALELTQNGIDDAWEKALEDKTKSKSDDPIKDAFQKRQKELEHLLNMEQITEAEYYKRLFDSKEYKALLADREKYADELNSIDEKFYKFQQTKYKEDADKQFDALDEQFKAGKISAEAYAKALNDLGQSLWGEGTLYAGTETAKKELESLDKKVKDVSDDIYSELKDSLSADGDRLLDDVLADADELSKKNIELFKNKGDLKTFKKNAEDIFKTVSASAEDALERGLITPERYKEIIDKYSKGLDTGTIQDAYDDAFDKIADDGKDKLDKMLIAPDEYFKLLDEWGKKLGIAEDVIQKYKDAVSESDYLDRWDLDNGYDENKSKDDYDLRAKRIEYIYELAEKLYGKNGQKNLKAYNALINQGLEDVESLVEDYYDEEIKKLEEINDEEEKRQKALELQLNLIKARQKLEETKNNRNQLVFHDGTFEYMADQDAVMSAEEDLAEAQKAILEQEREDQIKALEDQKTETLKFFDSVGGKLDDFIDRVKRFLSGDKDAFKVDESKAKTGSDTKSDNESNTNSVTTTTGSKDKTITSATDKTEINADNVEVKTDTGTSTVADITDTATTEEPVVSINDLVSNIDANVTGISETATGISDATKGIFDTIKAFANGFNFENLVRALGGNPTTEAVKNFQDSYNATLVGKQIVPSTLPNNITDNSSTTNNSAKTEIHIDKIFENLYMPQGTTKEQVEEFFKHLNQAILQRIPQALIEVSK